MKIPGPRGSFLAIRKSPSSLWEWECRRWEFMNSGVENRVFQDLQTKLNRAIYFAGSRVSISLCIICCGSS